MNSQPNVRVLRGRFVRITTVALAAWLSSCAHYETSWTASTVAPPSSIEVALERTGGDAPPETGKSPENGEPVHVNQSAPETISSLSWEEAIRTALGRNRAIAVEQYSPAIERTAIPEARAAFDPVLSLSASYREQNVPGAESSQPAATVRSTLEEILMTGQSLTTGSASTQTQSVLSTAQTLISYGETALQTSQELKQVIEDYRSSNIVHSEQFDAAATVSTYLPTGTEFYVTAGMTRDRSSTVSDSQYSGTWAVGVNQALLRGFGPAVNLVALRQAQNSTAIGRYAFEDFVLDVVQQIEDTYWSLALAQETLSIREFSLELAKEQLTLNEALLEVGKLARSSLITVQAEVASQEADLVDAQADLQVRSIELWRLLNAERGADGAIEFGTIAIPEPPAELVIPEQSRSLALLYRPDLAQARLNVANGELSAVQTKNGLLPQLDAFASYGRLSQGAGSSSWNADLDSSDYDNFEVGLNFEWAIGNRAENARHTRSKLRVSQMEDAVRNLEQAIESDVLQAAVEVQRQQKRIEATRQEVLGREEEFRVETDQFRLGRSTNLDVLQVQRDLVQAKVDEVSARVGLMRAIAGLYRAEGTALVRRGIATASNRETES